MDPKLKEIDQATTHYVSMIALENCTRTYYKRIHVDLLLSSKVKASLVHQTGEPIT